ncbi:50S ribosomal protein L32 [candidate division WOR-3 bacterium]|uniref:Large ribosomal subunit protein bL32 n=1 Tax=candidate division WOR-3 bacterium TaxID=2052148 RepID=A0A9D5K9K5_UNCW3|nr:50S ribosomal protein L32 [candidate division WOR-3 bacterium]MBD3364853.1 50S ribosomal protein L32 [candidate division WOR-3 bacterium]
MPVPKRRHSKSRGRKRRTHWKLEAPALSICPHCHEPKQPHRVCPNCGFYGDEEVIMVEQKKK